MSKPADYGGKISGLIWYGKWCSPSGIHQFATGSHRTVLTRMWIRIELNWCKRVNRMPRTSLLREEAS
eukprot:2354077-Prymnesium_polylepis.1